MDYAQYIKSLTPPRQPVDVVLDTDAYNEIDDQFAIAYLLSAPEKLRVKGICAAPFFNSRSISPGDGMKKSYREIQKLLKLTSRELPVYKGAASYLPDENTPAESDAASYLARLASQYQPENPLYIVAIGAATNIASALLLNPAMKESTVVVWLGGHGHHLPDTREFNMEQDIAAARVLFDSGVPVVQLPCGGVVDHFSTSRYELEHWLKGKNALCDYLLENTVAEAEEYAAGKPWTRVIWDVTAVAWLLTGEKHLMSWDQRPAPIPEYDCRYAFDSRRHPIAYVYQINRDRIFEDLFTRLQAFDH